MHVALADAQAHEFVHHLPLHFIIEAVAIARNNYLGRLMSNRHEYVQIIFLGSHLIGKILEPHMQGTIEINFLAQHTLLRENNPKIDQVVSVGKAGALMLVSNNINFKNLNFPQIMAEKGFPEDESDGVRNFFYRSDGYKLWNIFSRYVTNIVYRFYLSDTKVKGDNQIQRFASSLANRELGNITGFPSSIPTRADLVEVITSIIFAASATHHVRTI